MNCDKNSWHRITALRLSLTCCWPWDEKWDETDKQTVVTHCLSVMPWNMMRSSRPGRKWPYCTHCLSVMDEMRLPGSVITVLLLTGFCYRIRLWWNCLANNHCTVTHWLLVMEWDGISWQISLQHYDSLAVGHGMGWDEVGTKSVYCHSLPVSHEMRCDETAWKKITEFAATHHLLVMWWEVPIQCRKSVHCHSQTVDHGMICDETAWQKITEPLWLTCCWSWDEM